MIKTEIAIMIKIFKRRFYNIEGIIQGVGFRPTLYCYAVDSGLGGWIKNCSGKVELAIEGTGEELDTFIKNLDNNLPKLAKINKIVLVVEEGVEEKSLFKIHESEKDSEAKISIPADLAMCKDCEFEILDPANRRYGYAFTTCINCGPRYTVVNSMPYDRCRTTLVDFPLCSECEKEYTDPRNRRFHAESTACPVCGPKLWLADANGESVSCKEPILYTVKELREGKIAAIRGIGGYLLAADAFNVPTLEVLRNRKNRPDKPFAVMAKNLDIAEKYCFISQKEKDALTSSVAPIVILDVKNNDLSKIRRSGDRLTLPVINDNLPMQLLSPDSDTLGVMLPYSPLYKLLFENSNFELLVMTSGNRGGEPICIKNEEAFERLNGIADFFLCHNREINLRNDDSLCVMQGDELQVWRRGRGYAPDSINVISNLDKNILAMGAELKNTITVLSDNEAVISPHIGDLESPEAIDGLKQVVECFPEFLNKIPELVVVDKHPDMHSSRIGKKVANILNIPFEEVQHHHAHALSCMAENNLSEALALVFDGTGLGDDGNIWGAELLYCNISENRMRKAEGSKQGNFELEVMNYEKESSLLPGDSATQQKDYPRLATFSSAPLPGGDAAVYQPVRQLIGRLITSGIEPNEEFLRNYNVLESEYKIWEMQIQKGINSPMTHAAGRLFDAFSSLLKIVPDKITYEGQGAIRLEAYAKRTLINSNEEIKLLPYKTVNEGKLLEIDWSDMFLDLYNKKIWKMEKQEKELIALSFHHTVADATVEMIKYALINIKTENVVFSGGVFMNRILTALVKEKLKKLELNVYIHKKVPPNDGGISFGQSVVPIEKGF
jgi:hydrogenase maturation protein HypF